MIREAMLEFDSLRVTQRKRRLFEAFPDLIHQRQALLDIQSIYPELLHGA